MGRFDLTALVLTVAVLLASPTGILAGPAYHDVSPNRMHTVKTPVDGGIKEDVPARYRDRYDRWKAEFLATEFGRQQWERYAANKNFELTITVSGKQGKGAGTDKYLWDEAGNFVGATITLGDELNEGYPNPIYYPVMNSLSIRGSSYTISGKILAAAKLSHEFGHVNQTAAVSYSLMSLQTSLIPVYTSIFLKNGRNVRDQKLVEMAVRMGGTPVEIWENREYWSEVNALHYLNERTSGEDYHCSVLNRIKQNIETYAKEYEDRFDSQTEFANSPCWK